jgi:glycosyltransferase involved in cell wall biosynthesis
VLIPCLNESRGIRSVIEEFARELPDARLVVVDNGSDDETAEIARSAGAEVISEPRRGKARAVETALSRIDQDLVIMVDGDGSYPAAGASLLLAEYRATGADMITGIRTPESGSAVFRRFHRLGSSVLRRIPPGLSTRRDLFSGLRLFSRWFSQECLMARGFELKPS